MLSSYLDAGKPCYGCLQKLLLLESDQELHAFAVILRLHPVPPTGGGNRGSLPRAPSVRGPLSSAGVTGNPIRAYTDPAPLAESIRRNGSAPGSILLADSILRHVNVPSLVQVFCQEESLAVTTMYDF